MSEEFRQKLRAFAERAVSIAPRCTNEESTKLFLSNPLPGRPPDMMIETLTRSARSTGRTFLINTKIA